MLFCVAMFPSLLLLHNIPLHEHTTIIHCFDDEHLEFFFLCKILQTAAMHILEHVSCDTWVSLPDNVKALSKWWHQFILPPLVYNPSYCCTSSPKTDCYFSGIWREFQWFQEYHFLEDQSVNIFISVVPSFTFHLSEYFHFRCASLIITNSCIFSPLFGNFVF